LDPRLNVTIIRNAVVSNYPFTDYFKGFDKIEAVKKIFGEKTSMVLQTLRVEFFTGRGYMGVSDQTGHLRVNANYLKHGDIVDLYLDIIHELVHVKQFLQGRKLFDENYRYIERPTEIEAYRHSVEEARNLGLSDERIIQYLKTERRSEEDLKQMARTLKVRFEN